MSASVSDRHGSAHDPLGCALSYNKALRDAVEAVKAVYTPQEGTYIGLCIHADAVAAIEALGGEQ